MCAERTRQLFGMNQLCLNGGSAVVDSEYKTRVAGAEHHATATAYRCSCRTDFEGTYCEIDLTTVRIAHGKRAAIALLVLLLLFAVAGAGYVYRQRRRNRCAVR